MYRPTRSLGVDDLLQLQSLLAYEQDKRTQHIEECQKSPSLVHLHPIYRTASPSEISAAALAERERLAQAIFNLKALRDEYRRERTRQIQSYLEEYRRQALIRAALQEEEERYYRQCIAAAIEQRRAAEAWDQYRQLQAIERRPDYSQYRSDQLADLLQQLFGNQTISVEREREEEARQDEDMMAEVWKCLNEQKQQYETPRSVFLTPKQDASESIPSTPEHASSPEESDEEEEEEMTDEAQTKVDAPPPLSDHVVTLQDLINQLASQPVLVDHQRVSPAQKLNQAVYSDEPKPSGIWQKDQPSKAEKPQVKIPENDKKIPYLPQHAFTEAEPTPTREYMTDSPLTEENQAFVDRIAAEQQEETKEDPKKKAVEDLDEISRQLKQSELVHRWQQVLSQPLTFTKQEEGTLLLTATTDHNRAFLGSEDELVRVMLKLDTVDSLGDESIRNYRRELVKKCQDMLDQLDHHKQAELQKAVSKSKSQEKKKRRRHRRNQKRH